MQKHCYSDFFDFVELPDIVEVSADASLNLAWLILLLWFSHGIFINTLATDSNKGYADV